jgi:diguanylate cyclase (GGDEF)-like protein
MVRSVRESDQAVDDALDALRDAIRDRVEAEQLRDNLTNLASDLALTEWIEENAEEGTDFWVAFLEVDRFKSINDQYGYQDADEFLKEIGRVLERTVSESNQLECVAFRAHGDEFYLAGTVPSDEWDGALHQLVDDVRAKISAIAISVDGKSALRGTVSVGWLRSTRMRGAGEDVTERRVRSCVEIAVAEAKRRGRDQSVEYDKSILDADYLEGRQDCGSCGCKFTVQIDRLVCRPTPLFCPNCGQPAERPPSLLPPVST